jgi:hypothetical protein
MAFYLAGQQPSANEVIVNAGPGYCECVQSVVALDTDLISHRAIWVGGGGDLAVLDHDGHTVVIAGIPTGTLMPLSAKKILSAGTTVTKLVLWR